MSARKSPILTFLGAVGTVSGSRTLVEFDRKKFLVDCGLFQGPKKLRELNWEPFIKASEIDAVILTHAHIDHTGYLPKICKLGFNGPIYASQGTVDLCKFMLLDAAYLQEEDAHFANTTRHSKHFPALPLFTTEDAEKAISQLKVLPDNDWINLSENTSIKLVRSGHLLGSRFVQFHFGGQRNYTCTFSGDLGHHFSNVIKGPVTLTETDVLILESTYGDRPEPRKDPSDALKELILRVYQRNGVLVIPAFAVGRTQEVLFIIGELKRQNLIPDIKVYIDSPMALNATRVYKSRDEDLRFFLNGDGELNDPFHFASFEPVESVDASMLLCMRDGPFIVLSASGMLSGGRILHHLKHRLSDERNAVLFVGYQAEETKGRLLQNGIDTLRIHHTEIPVEAEICTIDSLSAHANSTEIIEWLKGFTSPIRHIFLNHGEPSATQGLGEKIKNELSHNVIIPKMGESFSLYDIIGSHK